MKYKHVGRIVEKLSVIGLGCWGFSGNAYWDNSDDDISIAVINAALDLGVNLLDVAPVYGKGHAEEVLGKAIRGRKREDFLIASKCGLLWDKSGREYNCLTRESVLKEIDDSLRRLGVDMIDVYQLHWPDPSTPLEETLDAIREIKKAGKIRYFGVTNFSTEQVALMDPIVQVDTQQGLYNMLERNPRIYHALTLVYRTERETLPQCLEMGQAFFPYSPLMQGLLSGHFVAEGNFSQNDVRRFNPKLNGARYSLYYEAARKLDAIAKKYGHPLNELAVNWLIENPAVTTVIGSALVPEQIAENMKALDWSISAEMRQEIETVIEPFKDI